MKVRKLSGTHRVFHYYFIVMLNPFKFIERTFIDRTSYIISICHKLLIIVIN